MAKYVPVSDKQPTQKYMMGLPNGDVLNIVRSENSFVAQIMHNSLAVRTTTLLADLPKQDPALFDYSRMTGTQLTDGSFVAAYVADDNTIRMFHFDLKEANGHALLDASETITPPPGGKLDQPVLQALPNGRYMLAYGAVGPDSNKVLVQIYEADGTPYGGAIELAKNRSMVGGWPIEREILNDGSFVILWHNDKSNGVGQRFSSTGEKIGIVSSMETTYTNKLSVIFDFPQEAGFSAPSDITKARDTINGSYGDDKFYADPDGLTTGDVISGGAGSDTIVLAEPGKLDITLPATFTGIEILKGSDGDDTFIVGPARLAGITTFDGGGGKDTIQLKIAGTYDFSAKTLISIEQISGTTGKDTITGSKADDSLYGMDGNDTLKGGAGEDILDGGTGADRMEGGEGGDDYYVDNAGDVVVEIDDGRTGHNSVISNGRIGKDGALGKDGAPGNAPGTYDWTVWMDISSKGAKTDRVFSTVSYTLTDHVECLALTGSAHIDGTGNGLDNAISGSGGNNVLRGMDGCDKIWGGGGSDTLDGGNGDDWLDGGYAHDILTGGAGKDAFVFGAGFGQSAPGKGSSWGYLNASSDTVKDFQHGEDRIVLSRTAFAALNSGDTLNADAFLLWNHGKGSAETRVIYEEASGKLFYDADGSGTAFTKVLIATFETKPSLDLSDFLLVA